MIISCNLFISFISQEERVAEMQKVAEQKRKVLEALKEKEKKEKEEAAAKKAKKDKDKKNKKK